MDRTPVQAGGDDIFRHTPGPAGDGDRIPARREDLAMTDLSVRSVTEEARTRIRLRFITATSLFDGHDASINVVRRLLQAAGAEVIHLGHNRSVEEIVTAAIQEDVHAIAVSSYQGGHLEFFEYMLSLLRERGASHIKIFGGGGGVIVPAEIDVLHARGVTRIYSPEDGARLGLKGMIADMMRLAEADLTHDVPHDLTHLQAGDRKALSRIITALEAETLPRAFHQTLREHALAIGNAPVLGITGTGGSGKSSLTDELTLRFRLDQQDRLDIAIIALDPSRRRTGGALLGDRIRMNAISSPRVYMRSLATREKGGEIAACVPDVIAACKVAGFDLIIVETPGIGQGDAGIVPMADVSLYVMTPEYGAPSQLEKIEMLDFADAVAINKFERRGAEDALRDVRKQVQRNRQAFGEKPENMPVFGTVAARFNDDGVTALYHALKARLEEHGLKVGPGMLPAVSGKASSAINAIVPQARTRYLAEIAQSVREYHARTEEQVRLVRERQQLTETRRMVFESQSSRRSCPRML